MGTEHKKDNRRNEDLDMLSAPPGFMSRTAFGLKNVENDDGSANAHAFISDSLLNPVCANAPSDMVEAETPKRSLRNRPWLLSQQSDHNQKEPDPEQPVKIARGKGIREPHDFEELRLTDEATSVHENSSVGVKVHSGSKRRRGRSVGRDLQGDGYTKPKIYATRSGCFAEIAVKRIIGVGVKSSLKSPLTTWRNWSREQKTEVWTILCEHFKFLPSEEKAREAFETHMSKNYTKWLSSARVDAMKRAKTNEINEYCKRYNPHWILPSVWSQLIDRFMTPEWKKKSEQNKHNRTINEDYVAYTGGRKSIDTYLKEAEKKGEDVVTVYCKTHRKKDSDSVPSVIQQRVDKYRAAVPESIILDSQSGSAHAPNFNATAWVEATGGVRKGTVRGFGNVPSHKLLKQCADSQSTGSSYAHATSSSVKPEVAEFINEWVAQMQLQIESQIALQIDQLETRIGTQMESLQSQIGALLECLQGRNQNK